MLSNQATVEVRASGNHEKLLFGFQDVVFESALVYLPDERRLLLVVENFEVYFFTFLQRDELLDERNYFLINSPYRLQSKEGSD